MAVAAGDLYCLTFSLPPSEVSHCVARRSNLSDYAHHSAGLEIVYFTIDSQLMWERQYLSPARLYQVIQS